MVHAGCWRPPVRTTAPCRWALGLGTLAAGASARAAAPTVGGPTRAPQNEEMVFLQVCADVHNGGKAPDKQTLPCRRTASGPARPAARPSGAAGPVTSAGRGAPKEEHVVGRREATPSVAVHRPIFHGDATEVPTPTTVAAVHRALLVLVGCSFAYAVWTSKPKDSAPEPSGDSKAGRDRLPGDSLGTRLPDEDSSSDQDLVTRARIQASTGAPFGAPAPPMEAQAQEAVAGLADLSGRWQLMKVDGEAGTIMSDLGLLAILRVARGRPHQGRPRRQAQEIVQVGNAFQIRTITQWNQWTFPEHTVKKFLVGAGEQAARWSTEGDALLRPRWDGHVLVIEERKRCGGKERALSERWEVQGEQLILHTTSPKGIALMQFYTKEPRA